MKLVILYIALGLVGFSTEVFAGAEPADSPEVRFISCMNLLEKISTQGEMFAYNTATNSNRVDFTVAKKKDGDYNENEVLVYTKTGVMDSGKNGCIELNKSETRPPNVAAAGRVFSDYLERVRKAYFTDSGSGWLDKSEDSVTKKNRLDKINAEKKIVTEMVSVCGNSSAKYKLSNGQSENLGDYFRQIAEKSMYFKGWVSGEESKNQKESQDSAPVQNVKVQSGKQ